MVGELGMVIRDFNFVYFVIMFSIKLKTEKRIMAINSIREIDFFYCVQGDAKVLTEFL